jgi:hypothetical protein
LPIITLLRTRDWLIPSEAHNEDYDESLKVASRIKGDRGGQEMCPPAVPYFLFDIANAL